MFKQYTSIYGDESILLIVFHCKIGGILCYKEFRIFVNDRPAPGPSLENRTQIGQVWFFYIELLKLKTQRKFSWNLFCWSISCQPLQQEEDCEWERNKKLISQSFCIETKRFLGQYLQCWLSTKLQLVDSPAYREHVWISFYFVSINFLICHILSKGDLPTINPPNWDIKYHVFTQCQRISNHNQSWLCWLSRCSLPMRCKSTSTFIILSDVCTFPNLFPWHFL